MSALEKLNKRMADVNALHSSIAVLDWDHQVNMPGKAAHARAQHVSMLSRMAHEIFTADETRKAAQEAATEVDPDSVDGATVRVVQRHLDLATKLPTELVERKSRLSSEGHEVWVKARANNDFKSFAPLLNELFEICREEAECYGYTDHIYDALLDTYEEGATAADCRRMYEALKGPVVDLVKGIQERGKPVDDSPLYGKWAESAQRDFGNMLVGAIGFDLSRGRQDTAPHPFCTNFSVNDVRLTTRYKDYVGSAIFGSLHEAGHGMYEQGSPQEWDLTPLAGGVSLGIHESQSRTWENIVGRSKAFWSHFLPQFHQAFPALAGYDLNSFYRMINKVEPSFIRVEADEVTYNLHTLVRFEVECDMLTKAISVNDIPEAWNSKYQQYLGITPKNDSEGCLQDVHWSGGSIGYFPTYSMGNLLSYQFWTVLQKDLGDTDALMAKGDFAPILGWLQEKIYSQGKRHKPKDLVMAVTGKPMGAEDYVAALTAKYKDIYEL